MVEAYGTILPICKESKDYWRIVVMMVMVLL